MSFVQIVGPRDVFDRVISEIQDLGVLHLEEIPLIESGGLEVLHRAHLSDRQVQQKDAYEALVQQLDEDVLRHIPKAKTKELRSSKSFSQQYSKWSQKTDAAVTATAKELLPEVRSFLRRRRNLDSDLRVLTGYEEVVGALMPLLANSDHPDDYEFVGVILDRKNRQACDFFPKQLRKLTAGECQCLQANLRKNRLAMLIGYDKQFDSPVRDFVAEAGIAEIRGPRYLRGKGITEILATIEADLKSLRERQAALQALMEKFFAEKGSLLLALQAICHDRLTQLNAISNFAQTRYTFVMEGWVPNGRLAEVTDRLSQVDGKTVVVRKLKAHGAAGSPPVLLDNFGPVRPFEQLLALLPLPRYGTTDATSFVATFFPPLFGLMLADIAYGLILVLGALLLYKLTRAGSVLRALSSVLGWCALYTILMGFVFGEFLGPLGHELGLKPIWRERLTLTGSDSGGALLSYLGLAVAVGVVHILCGLTLGIRNAYKTGEKAQLLNYVARIVGLFGLFCLIGSLTQVLPSAFMWVGIAVLLLFLALMISNTMQHPMHGLMLPLELVSTLGNILSYARIMAVGIASAVLAMLAMRFGSMINNVVLAVVVVILIHALNLVLGVVDPTIQGLRLHYVEFFSKFYVAGGRAYLPLRKMGDEIC